MMARVGSFPPALARYFIQAYSSPGDIVFDPFCGKGTGIVEAILAGRRALGCDIAPDAVAVTRAKVAGVSMGSIDRCLVRMSNEVVSDVRGAKACPREVKVFFDKETLAELLGVREWLLLASGRSRSARFLLGCLLGILHGHAGESLSVPSAHAYAMAPAYVRRYKKEHGLAAPRRQVLECLRAKAAKSLPPGLPIPRGEARVYQGSAERYSFPGARALDDTIDLIVTSPPYFKAQTYAKDAWLRLWLLGYDYRNIGREYITTGSRATYEEKMVPCLSEMLRVLKPGCYAFVVAGDVTLRSRNLPVTVRTAEILGQVALSISLGNWSWEIVGVVEDAITAHSRYLFPVHKNGNTPALEPKKERILYLRKVPGKRGHTKAI